VNGEARPATHRRAADVGRVLDEVTPEIAAFIAAQRVFFVATAPTTGGHANCSPKGLDTFAVIDPGQVAYLDLTGSGAETIAHLRQNGRITLMFCSFEDKPNIVRIYGRGKVLEVSSPEAAPLLARWPEFPGARSVVEVSVTRVSTSCGYAVPLLRYEGERSTLLEWAERKGPSGLRDYRAEKNTHSIDGLPTLTPDR
jgi:Pyridoxamine 5'-phosphate oxidase